MGKKEFATILAHRCSQGRGTFARASGGCHSTSPGFTHSAPPPSQSQPRHFRPPPLAKPLKPVGHLRPLASLPPLPAQRGPERCIAGRVHDGQVGHQAGHVDARGQGVGADEEFNDSRAQDLQVRVWGGWRYNADKCGAGVRCGLWGNVTSVELVLIRGGA